MWRSAVLGPRENKMSDDKKKTGKPDQIRVNKSEPYEVNQVAKKLDVTPAVVKKAIEKVGPMRKDVEAEIKKGKK